MRRIIYILGLLMFLVSCTGDKEVKALLDRAEALMEAHPDSAYETLSSLPLKGGELKGSSERAFYLLLFANASYKLGKPMPSDTVFQEVVDYYDRHGNANERMLAYYLMGGIYLTRHEAPMALQWYLDATEQADTLSPDCDNWALMKVYGQMAELYHSQLMPKEEIEANRKFSIYAEKAGNTYQAIRGIEKQLGAYQLMSDTAMILALTDSVHDLYLQADMPQAAASVYPAAIHIHLARHDYPKAKELMDIFETQSGLFDTEGNIAKSREHYYQSKGIYYEGIGMLDSAEYYYRRLLPYGFELDAYRGLISVFKTRQITDSVVSLIPLYERSFNVLENSKHAQAMRQVDAIYDYSRNQKIAQQKEIETINTRSRYLPKRIHVALRIIFISFTFIAFYFLYHTVIAELNWKRIADRSLEGQTEQMIPFYQKIHDNTILRYDGYFLYNYAAELNFINRYDESLQILHECLKEIYDYDVALLYADNYQNIHQNDSVIKYATLASNMIPCRFLPYSYLLQAYNCKKDKAHAILIAKKIHNKKVKIPSPMVDEVKSKADNYLKSQ